MWTILKKLIKIKLLTPKGLWHLVKALWQEGTNLMVLLRWSAQFYPDRIAVDDGQEALTYQALFVQSMQLAQALKKKQLLGNKVAILSRNHAAQLKAIFAVSRLGVDVFLLNVEMSADQLNHLLAKQKFDTLIYDQEVAPLVEQSNYQQKKILTYHATQTNIQALSQQETPQALKPQNKSRIIVLTGGTSGNFKVAARKPSVFTFLNPFFALLSELDIDKYRKLYIGTPIYHGFGVAAMIIGVILGSRMFLRHRFDKVALCQLIRNQEIEVATLVPLMFRRMLQQDAKALRSLQCIILGGAVLPPRLVEQGLRELGPKLANLYGTTEAGFSIMATPQALAYADNTIGKPIRGVRIKIVNAQGDEQATGKVGQLLISNSWSMMNKDSQWVDTGDLAYQDEEGYLFLCGRSDDMIVSGGENVYPIEVERILQQHAQIKEVAVIGIADKEFGQRLKAFIVLTPKTKLSATDILQWAKKHLARYQQPKAVVIKASLPYTSIGKVNKKALANE